MAENAWNSRDEVRAFSRRERDYRLKKWFWYFSGNHIGVEFQYECHDAAANGIAPMATSYGNSRKTA